MDTFIRTIAIIIEVLILLVIAYVILNGVRLIVFDLGIKAKYNKIITTALVTVGFILLIFFVAHLTTFYPPA